MLRLITNPIFLRMAGAFVGGVVVMMLFVWVIRRMRKSISAEGNIDKPRTDAAANFTLAAYQGVIQKFKEQERELGRLRDEERQRAATTEKINTAVLSQLASGVVLFNKQGLVQQANPAAKTIFGYASPLGLHARDLFKGVQRLRSDVGASDGEPATLADILKSCTESGQSAQRLEADYITPQGGRRVLGFTLSPVRDPQGQPLGVACLATDLTEISDLAQQMRLRENLASLGEMSAGIAHEFKNSLATISGYAQMLCNERDAETVNTFAVKIADETSNLTRVVTDFLNFAKPPEDTAATREALELRPLLEECARGSSLELDLTECSAGLAINGDATAWRQAFSNLLRNSAEAGRDGQPVAVKISAAQQADRVQIKFRDNGCGIPPEQLQKIFVPFFTTKSRGTGLGLALVHKIVTQHGGTISVASDSAGTEFTIALPANANS